MATGAVVWHAQRTEGDVLNGPCNIGDLDALELVMGL